MTGKSEWAPPRRITISVTAEDIRRGRPHDAEYDPISIAARRQLTADGQETAIKFAEHGVATGQKTISFIFPDDPADMIWFYNLPEEAVRFISYFDSEPDETPGPFTFTVTGGEIDNGDRADV